MGLRDSQDRLVLLGRLVQGDLQGHKVPPEFKVLRDHVGRLALVVPLVTLVPQELQVAREAQE